MASDHWLAAGQSFLLHWPCLSFPYTHTLLSCGRALIRKKYKEEEKMEEGKEGKEEKRKIGKNLK